MRGKLYWHLKGFIWIQSYTARTECHEKRALTGCCRTTSQVLFALVSSPPPSPGPSILEVYSLMLVMSHNPSKFRWNFTDYIIRLFKKQNKTPLPGAGHQKQGSVVNNLHCLHWVNYFMNTPRKWSHTAIPHRLKNNKIRLNHFFFYCSSLSHDLLKFLCSTIPPFQLFQLCIPEKVIQTELEGIYCTAIKSIGAGKFCRTVSGI